MSSVKLDPAKPVCAGCGAVNVSADGLRCETCARLVENADLEREQKKAAIEAAPPSRYRMLAVATSEALEHAVNVAIAQGWELHGDTFPTHGTIGDLYWCQALKRSKEAAEEARA